MQKDRTEMEAQFRTRMLLRMVVNLKISSPNNTTPISVHCPFLIPFLRFVHISSKALEFLELSQCVSRTQNPDCGPVVSLSKPNLPKCRHSLPPPSQKINRDDNTQNKKQLEEKLTNAVANNTLNPLADLSPTYSDTKCRRSSQHLQGHLRALSHVCCHYS
jgi:hypothetical protein